MIKDGPFKSALDQPEDGVIKQELVTYKLKGKMLIKETVTRKYKSNDDYYDSSSSEPLMEIV